MECKDGVRLKWSSLAQPQNSSSGKKDTSNIRGAVRRFEECLKRVVKETVRNAIESQLEQALSSSGERQLISAATIMEDLVDDSGSGGESSDCNRHESASSVQLLLVSCPPWYADYMEDCVNDCVAKKGRQYLSYMAASTTPREILRELDESTPVLLVSQAQGEPIWFSNLVVALSNNTAHNPLVVVPLVDDATNWTNGLSLRAQVAAYVTVLHLRPNDAHLCRVLQEFLSDGVHFDTFLVRSLLESWSSLQLSPSEMATYFCDALLQDPSRMKTEACDDVFLQQLCELSGRSLTTTLDIQRWSDKETTEFLSEMREHFANLNSAALQKNMEALLSCCEPSSKRYVAILKLKTLLEKRTEEDENASTPLPGPDPVESKMKRPSGPSTNRTFAELQEWNARARAETQTSKALDHRYKAMSGILQIVNHVVEQIRHVQSTTSPPSSIGQCLEQALRAPKKDDTVARVWQSMWTDEESDSWQAISTSAWLARSRETPEAFYSAIMCLEQLGFISTPSLSRVVPLRFPTFT